MTIVRETTDKWIPWIASGHKFDIAFLEQSWPQDSWIPFKRGAGDIIAFVNILPHGFRVLHANEAVSGGNLAPMAFRTFTKVSLEMCSVDHRCRRQPDTTQKLYSPHLAVQQ